MVRFERYTFRLLLERFAEDRRLDALTSPDLEEYVAWRLERPGGLGRPISRTTANRDLAHLSAFFSWCQDRGYVRDGFNPARARRRRRIDVESGEGAVSVRGVHYIPADLHAMRAAVKRWGRAAGRATGGRVHRKPRTEPESPSD